MTNEEIESALDKLIALTEKLADELAPLVKATESKFVLECKPEIYGRADGLVSEVRTLRQSFDKNRGISAMESPRVGFQTEVRS